MTARERHIQKMKEIRKEMETAGAIHRKDLDRQYRRMLKDLQVYDELQRG